MQIIQTIILIVSSGTWIRAEVSQDQEKLIEKDIHKAFEAAFSNRSQDLDQFFNKTFGSGVDQDEMDRRFKEAWDTTSHGVHRFINETYTNISRIIQGKNDTQNVKSTLAKKERGDNSTPVLTDHSSKDHSPSGNQNGIWSFFRNIFPNSSHDTTPVAPPRNRSHKPQGTVPTGSVDFLTDDVVAGSSHRTSSATNSSENIGEEIWNDIKGIFEGNKRTTREPSVSHVTPPSVRETKSAMMPLVSSPSSSHLLNGGFTLGMVGIILVVYVLYQAGLQKSRCRFPSSRTGSEVHSGYVQIA